MTWQDLGRLVFAVPALGLVAIAALPAGGEPATAAPAAVVSAPASELALAPGNCTYYSNASKTVVVGQFGFDCCNNPVAWGKKSKYHDCGGCFPCFPPPQ